MKQYNAANSNAPMTIQFFDSNPCLQKLQIASSNLNVGAGRVMAVILAVL